MSKQDTPLQINSVLHPLKQRNLLHAQESSPTGNNGLNDLKSRFANVSLGGVKPPPTIKSPPPPIEQSRPSQSPPPPKIVTGKRPPPPHQNPVSKTALPPPPPPQPPPQSPSTPNPPSAPPPPQPGPPKTSPSTLKQDGTPPNQCNKSPTSPPTPPAQSPPPASLPPGSGSASNITWLYTATFAVRWTTDLSRTYIRVTWSSNNPSSTVRGQQKHFPPPVPLAPAELERAAGLYGAGVRAWCQRQLGRQVGNGECWTLAHDALEFVAGTVTPKCMVSCGTIHGQCVYARDRGVTTAGGLMTVREGDIVQYLECKFERRQNGRVVYSSTAGAPDHTSYPPSPPHLLLVG